MAVIRAATATAGEGRGGRGALDLPLDCVRDRRWEKFCEERHGAVLMERGITRPKNET